MRIFTFLFFYSILAQGLPSCLDLNQSRSIYEQEIETFVQLLKTDSGPSAEKNLQKGPLSSLGTLIVNFSNKNQNEEEAEKLLIEKLDQMIKDFPIIEKFKNRILETAKKYIKTHKIINSVEDQNIKDLLKTPMSETVKAKMKEEIATETSKIEENIIPTPPTTRKKIQIETLAEKFLNLATTILNSSKEDGFQETSPELKKSAEEVNQKGLELKKGIVAIRLKISAEKSNSDEAKECFVSAHLAQGGAADIIKKITNKSPATDTQALSEKIEYLVKAAKTTLKKTDSFAEFLDREHILVEDTTEAPSSIPPVEPTSSTLQQAKK